MKTEMSEMLKVEPRVISIEEVDLPPEFCRYRDDGCDFSPSCLDCPFEKCLDEEPGGRKRYLKIKRDSEIIRAFEN
jgi:hypothetical protein